MYFSPAVHYMYIKNNSIAHILTDVTGMLESAILSGNQWSIWRSTVSELQTCTGMLFCWTPVDILVINSSSTLFLSPLQARKENQKLRNFNIAPLLKIQSPIHNSRLPNWNWLTAIFNQFELSGPAVAHGMRNYRKIFSRPFQNDVTRSPGSLYMPIQIFSVSVSSKYTCTHYHKREWLLTTFKIVV